MPLKKRHLVTHFTFLASGLLLGTSPDLRAQTPQFSCRPNNAGDGWICEPVQGGDTNTATDSRRYDSPGAVLPGPVSPPAPAAQPTAPAVTQEPEQAQPEPDESEEEVADSSNIEAGEIPAAPSPQTIARPVASGYPLDWVPVEAMTEAQRAQLNPNCCGAFIDADRGAMGPAAAPGDSGIQFTASTGLSQVNQNLISIDGDVVVQQGFRTITNDDTTSIDRDSNTVLMDGNVEFREPLLLIQGSSAFIDSESDSSRIENAQYVLHDYGAHGEATSIVYNSESGLVSIENGEFSRCEPENNFWRISARSIVLDQGSNRGYAEGAQIRLGNVPIFYYPWTLPFPLGDERISGFLAPSTGSTRNGGFDFELPYYLNIAPQADATLSPRLISDRGVMASAEFRYLASWSMNTLNMSYLGNDDLYDPLTANQPGSISPPVENRWFVGFEHNGLIGSNISTFVDYSGVSDVDYFYDLGSNGLNVASQTHLNRQAQLNYYNPFFQAGVNVQRIQIIDPFASLLTLQKPYDRMPELYFNTDFYIGAGFSIGLRAIATSFDRDLNDVLLTPEQLDNGALVTGERFNIEPRLGWSVENPGWFVRANASFKQVSYDLSNQAMVSEQDPSVSVPVYSLDSGLVFERNSSDGSSLTLEPRLYYLYSEFEDQSLLPLFDSSELNFSFNQLFREDRFSGGDRISDADQLSAAITSRYLGANGRELARVSLGQIHYFADRQVTLGNPLQNWIPRYSPLSDTSAIAAEFAFSFGPDWQLSADGQWNEDTGEVDEGNFRLRYQADADHILNLNYRYRQLVNSPLFILPPGIDPRIKQTDVSGVWPLGDSWKLLARWNYDHANERNLESFAGVEYSNCCTTIRLVAREWVDENELFIPGVEPQRGIFVQLTLHGLGNLTGGGLSNLLQDGIRGFRDSSGDDPVY